MTSREAIAPQLGGGFIVTGACGRPHLKGPAWSWWRCKPCMRAQTAATVRAVEQIRLSLYYPDVDPNPRCGVPTFIASHRRHTRAGQGCQDCQQGARAEQRERDRSRGAA